MTTRENEIIKLVMNQTNYSEEETKDKLKEWNNNYINVIKEYLNPDFNKPKEKEEENISLNQKMMKGYRDFMDDVYIKFEKRKKYNERVKEYQEYVKAQQELVEKQKQSKKDEVEIEEAS